MIVALLLAVGALAGSTAATPVTRARHLMGTLCTVAAEGADSARVARALEAGLDEIARLEAVMSSWRADSELSLLNAAAGAVFRCSADLHAVLDTARVLARQTDGAFDPTVEPLMAVWDLRGSGRVPTRAERERAGQRVDFRRLVLDHGTHSARLAGEGTAVDLGGIGKGFALDRAAEVLGAAGVERALLNLGGELLALGAWTVEVAHPADRLRPAVALAARDAAVSTSAQSERGFSRRGRRYGHVLDPRTGLPVESRASVTVVARSASRADALSTALLVLGRERAAGWCARHAEVGVLWLEPAGPGVRAWAWNVPVVAAAPGARIEWMNVPSATSAVP